MYWNSEKNSSAVVEKSRDASYFQCHVRTNKKSIKSHARAWQLYTFLMHTWRNRISQTTMPIFDFLFICGLYGFRYKTTHWIVDSLCRGSRRCLWNFVDIFGVRKLERWDYQMAKQLRWCWNYVQSLWLSCWVWRTEQAVRQNCCGYFTAVFCSVGR